MRNLSYFLLTMTLIGCQTIKFKPPQEYKYLISVDSTVNPPIIYCFEDNLNDDRLAYVVEIAKCNNVIGVKPSYLNKLDSFYADKLKRLEICLLSPKKCQ